MKTFREHQQKQLGNLRKNETVLNLEHFWGKFDILYGKLYTIITADEVSAEKLLDISTKIAALLQYMAERFLPISAEIVSDEEQKISDKRKKVITDKLRKMYHKILEEKVPTHEIQKNNMYYKFMFDDSFLGDILDIIDELSYE